MPPLPVEKNTRSPTCNSPRETGLPSRDWALDECGREMPSFMYTCLVKPEQSNPTRDVPPLLYLVPLYVIALRTTR